MSTDLVLIERAQRLWRVTLNRPQAGNACSPELVRKFHEAIDEAVRERAQAVVIQGQGRHFCTGFDLSDLAQETDDTLLARFVRIELLLQSIARAPFPVVAVAHGRAMGAGADIFAACSVRLATSDTSFAFPGARGFGLVLGTRRLATRVGVDAALEWVETGRTIGAEEACRRGLITAVVEGPGTVDEIVAARANPDPILAVALRRATDARADANDASDLDLLVRSAARPGLRDRIADYLERNAAARRKAAQIQPA
ncbi:enoyl-CoA hydratase/isomerase family protein [Variovorax paradoxus]|nr:enoyl-CoA hydratase/isomerase family protein [Variovorax paradoxus]MBT2304828.1 enoyl-CoA hydratase/isomerase family protein [Variovorax paradoxus]